MILSGCLDTRFCPGQRESAADSRLGRGTQLREDGSCSVARAFEDPEKADRIPLLHKRSRNRTVNVCVFLHVEALVNDYTPY